MTDEFWNRVLEQLAKYEGNAKIRRVHTLFLMEGDVKAGGGFPLEAEDDVAAVEKDVGAAVGGPNPQGDSIRESQEIFTAKSAKEDLGLKAKRRERGERGGRRGEFDCMALLASWRFIFFSSVRMI